MQSILIIENDEDYRELLELGLNDLGYQVTPSSNAMGCDTVLDKPFTIKELEKSIQSVL